MLTKKHIRVLVVVCFLLLALGIGPGLVRTALAQPPAEVTATSGVTIPYSGQLTSDDGKPVVDGVYDFTFTLYDAVDGGSRLWSEAHIGVSIQAGVFTVLLGNVSPLPLAVKDGVFWLGTSVRGPQDQLYAALAPRQQMGAVIASTPANPATAGTCAHTHVGEFWNGSVGSPNGVFKVSNDLDGPSIWGVNSGGGNAIHGDAYGNGIGIYGGAQDGPGVVGNSATGNGVQGITQATTAGLSGVYGSALNGFGVTGESPTFFGLQARGNDASGTDFIGDLFLDGLRGEIMANDILNVQSKGNLNLDIDFDNNDTGTMFQLWANNTTAVLTVDQLGNTTATGTLAAKVSTVNYNIRSMYSVNSPEVWFEDFGTAVLVNGVVTVTIEPIYAETVNLSEYHVFVTPVCADPVVLYVTGKTPAGFTVKGVGLDSLPSACSFDYRIITKRLGYESVRMEEFDATTQLNIDRK
jgi:hypothetical protein